MRRFGVVTEEQQEDERGDWYLAKQIAAGILIAAAVIFVGFHLYLYLAVRAAAEVAEEATQQFRQEIQAQSEKTEAVLRAETATRRIDAERRAAMEMQRREEIARQTKAAADQARAEQATAAAKRQAWQRFYQPPKKCDSPPDWDTQVECGNAHIKAQREFESRWARGDI
jgi:hypothetical protein